MPLTIVEVFLVNGESRRVRIGERSDVNGVIRFILHRLRVNMDVAPQLFGIQLVHQHGHESYWLQPGYTIQELLHEYCGMRPREEWRFLLKIRVFPKTPQHLLIQDPVTFQYFFDQVLHTYLEDKSIKVDNDTAVKLGCLELRRFYKDMPLSALKKKENFTMLEREIGLKKFFKQSLLNSVKRRNLRTMVQNTFQQYESLTMEGCVFHFFSLLSKYHAFDVERFTYCAVGDDQSLPLTCDIFVGPNCNVEYQTENGLRRFLAAFNDIQDISYKVELISRGRVILNMISSPPVFIRTAQQMTAVHLATLIDSYCMVYTTIPQSRMIGGEQSSDHSSFVEEHQDDFVPPEDDPVLQQTTVVVKAVMELSNKVPLSQPTDYVEFVKNVGLALRDLLSKVDEVLQDLPQQTHLWVSRAHKVLSSDMAHLVEAMKNAQKHHQTFLEQEYRKQMFQAAHIVAVNSKQLMDTVNIARRKAH